MITFHNNETSMENDPENMFHPLCVKKSFNTTSPYQNFQRMVYVFFNNSVFWYRSKYIGTIYFT